MAARLDAGKVNGRKRQTLADTDGWLATILFLAPDIQDLDGDFSVLASLRHAFPCFR